MLIYSQIRGQPNSTPLSKIAQLNTPPESVDCVAAGDIGLLRIEKGNVGRQSIGLGYLLEDKK